MHNIFFIHLDHDIGRYKLINKFRKKIGGVIWTGINNRIYDKDKHILDNKNKTIGTIGCTQTMINIFEYLNKIDKKPQYVTIFEDDIIAHKNFYKNWEKVKNFIREVEVEKTNSNWKLIYLGVSTPINEYDTKNNSNFSINKLPNNKIFTGGFGIIINRSMFKLILSLLKKYKNLPHDIYVYGYIQSKYNNDCYVCLPNIVIADVLGSNIRDNRDVEIFSNKMKWTLTDYVFPKRINMFILINNNKKRINNFLDIIGIFYPIVKPIFIKLNDDSLEIKSILTKLNSFATVIKCKDRKDILRIAKKYYDYDKNYPYFILTNISINWTNSLKNNFWSIIKNKMFDYLLIKIPIRKCSKCNKKNSVVHGLEYHQGFNIFSTKILNGYKINKKNTYYYDLPFYTINSCTDLGEDYEPDNKNTFHKLSHYDFIDDIDEFNKDSCYYSNKNYSYCYSFFSTLKSPMEWINLLNRWRISYVKTAIYNLFELHQELEFKMIIPCVFEIKMDNSLRKKFNTPDFRVTKLRHKFFKDRLEIYFGNIDLVKLFGSDRYNFINKVINDNNLEQNYNKNLVFIIKFNVI